MNRAAINWEQLPLLLTVKDIQASRLFPLGRNGLYNLLHSRGFPAIRLGRRFVVPRDALRAWLEKQAQRD